MTASCMKCGKPLTIPVSTKPRKFAEEESETYRVVCPHCQTVNIVQVRK